MKCGACGSTDTEARFSEERGQYEGWAQCKGFDADGKKCDRRVEATADDYCELVKKLETMMMEPGGEHN